MLNERELIKILLNRTENLSVSDCAYVHNKTVLVTGGGGSIGGELCRQLATKTPKKLIILDCYENGAYDVEQELKFKYPSLDIVVEIATLRERGKIKRILKKHRPDVVFNAGAHKHVPLMENAPDEAVKNNVLGTKNIAELCGKFGVEKFVQISTDKAVNPTSVMGATKLVCEKIICVLSKKYRTKFVAVRFGNVFNSSGSVIPLFYKQILSGGPVTVTDKNIVRYFMTVSEAVSLLLTAGSSVESGQIYVLDMGEPVNIYDLANKMIKHYNSPAEIKIIGLRPGEKLYEERLYADEQLVKTDDKRISIVRINSDKKLWFNFNVNRLIRIAKKGEKDVVKMLKKILPEYIGG